MEITEDVSTAHSRLSGSFRRLLDYANDHPDFQQALDYLSAGIPEWVKSYPTTIQAWPVLASLERIAEFRRAAVGITELVKSIPQRVFENDSKRLAEFYEIDNDLLITFLLAPPDGLDGMLCRCDFVDGPQGFRCIETNFGGNIGGWQHAFWEEACRLHPPNAMFFEVEGIDPHYRNPLWHMLAHLVESTIDRSLAEGNLLNLGIVVPQLEIHLARPATDYLNGVYSEVLRGIDSRLEGQLVVVAPAELEIRDMILLFHKQIRLHALVDASSESPKLQGAQRSFKAGGVSLYDSPLSRLLSSKKNIALLSELSDSDLFDREERALIEEFIPRTVRIEPGNLEFLGESGPAASLLKARQDDIVLKIGYGSSGGGVHVGRFLSADEWSHHIETALAGREDWVAQEFLESWPYLLQHGDVGCAVHDMAWGLFCFGSTYAGGFVRIVLRASSDGVINSSRGAIEGILFEI